MPDHVVMPPMSCCSCPFCTKRRWELDLAARIEREWHSQLRLDYEVLAAERGRELEVARAHDRRQWLLQPSIQPWPSHTRQQRNRA